MSTFGGKIEKIAGISVDRFDEENLNSEVFFLSHCHSDHMIGLCDVFFYTLKETNRYLYASEISCKILEQKYVGSKNNLKPLSPYFPTDILLGEKVISVISVPAGHCPGSLMFLFESDLRILYTGDYRIHKNDIKKLKAFYSSQNKVKTIDKIYLDTTFFSKAYPQFPSREQSLKELCRIIKNVLEPEGTSLVNVRPSAFYGYECCFKEIYQKFGQPVHVNKNTYECYRYIPEMDNCVTLNGSITNIHSHCGEKFRTLCDFSSGRFIHNINLTAFRWTEETLQDGDISIYQGGIHYVCYSTHASYEEGVALLEFLKPKEIEICVRYKENPERNQEMEKLINDVLEKIKRESFPELEPKLFKVMDIKRKNKDENKKRYDDLEVLKSPVQIRKKFKRAWSEELRAEDGHLVRNEKSTSLPLQDVNESMKTKENVTVRLLNKLGINSPGKKGRDEDEVTASLFDMLGINSPPKKSVEERENIHESSTSYIALDERESGEYSEENCTNTHTKDEDFQSTNSEFPCSSSKYDFKSINEIFGLTAPEKIVPERQSKKTYYENTGASDEIYPATLDELYNFCTPQKTKPKETNSCVNTTEDLPSTSYDPKKVASQMSPNSDDGNIILGIINSTAKRSLHFNMDTPKISEDESQNSILMSFLDSASNSI